MNESQIKVLQAVKLAQQENKGNPVHQFQAIKPVRRTVDNMTPAAKWRAYRLAAIIDGPIYDEDHFIACRDEYYAMFKDDKNFRVEG